MLCSINANPTVQIKLKCLKNFFSIFYRIKLKCLNVCREYVVYMWKECVNVCGENCAGMWREYVHVLEKGLDWTRNYSMKLSHGLLQDGANDSKNVFVLYSLENLFCAFRIGEENLMEDHLLGTISRLSPASLFCLISKSDKKLIY